MVGVGVKRIGTALSSAPAAAVSWKIDPTHSFVQFEVVQLGLIPFPGRFKQFSAKFDYVQDDIEKSSVDVRIPIECLETDDGLMNEILQGEQFFDVGNFQEMRFISTKITLTGANTGVIDGELTMKGETWPIQMTATFTHEAKAPFLGTPRIGVIASATIDRVKWGLGAWRPFVDREVSIQIAFEATPN